jgi:hypothetical protein
MSQKRAASISIDAKGSMILRNVGKYYRSAEHNVQEDFNLHALELCSEPRLCRDAGEMLTKFPKTENT